MDGEGVKLVIEALALFQEWKTERIRRDKEKHGANWGDATGWNMTNWMEHNDALVKVMWMK